MWEWINKVSCSSLLACKKLWEGWGWVKDYGGIKCCLLKEGLLDQIFTFIITLSGTLQLELEKKSMFEQCVHIFKTLMWRNEEKRNGATSILTKCQHCPWSHWLMKWVIKWENLSLTFNSMSHNHVQCGCVHSSMPVLHIMASPPPFIFMHCGWSFILKAPLLRLWCSCLHLCYRHIRGRGPDQVGGRSCGRSPRRHRGYRPGVPRLHEEIQVRKWTMTLSSALILKVQCVRIDRLLNSSS